MEAKRTKAKISQEVEAEMAMVIRSRTMAKLKTPESPGETGDVIPGLRSSAKGC